MKKVISLLLALVLCLSLCACANNKLDYNVTDDNTLASNEEYTETTSITVPTTEKIRRYDEGEYIVGKDIPAGEYVIFPKSEYSFKLFSNSQYTQTLAESSGGTNSYLMLKDEQCLIISSGYVVSVDDAEIDSSSNYAIFKVGVDIEPGEYTFVCDDSLQGGEGDNLQSLWYVHYMEMEDNGVLGQRDYCGISATSFNYFTYTYVDDNFVEYDTVNYDITVKEGEYIKVWGGFLVRK